VTLTLPWNWPRLPLGKTTSIRPLLHDESWSLERLRQYLDTFPLRPAELNSRYAKSLFDEVEQKRQVLTKQINECALIIEELRQKKNELRQIFDQLRPLLQRVNERKDFFSSIFSLSAGSDNSKQQARELINRGLQLCPTHPALVNFDKDFLLKR
jgi:hypothetical protein